MEVRDATEADLPAILAIIRGDAEHHRRVGIAPTTLEAATRGGMNASRRAFRCSSQPTR